MLIKNNPSSPTPRFGAIALGQQENMWLRYASPKFAYGKLHIFPIRYRKCSGGKNGRHN